MTSKLVTSTRAKAQNILIPPVLLLSSEPSVSSCWLTFRFWFSWLFRFFVSPSKQRLIQISGILTEVMENHLVVPASHHQVLLFKLIKYRISDSYCQLHLDLHDRQCSDTACTLLKKGTCCVLWPYTALIWQKKNPRR